MTTTIRLYGALGKEFGTSHHFQIASSAEAFQALAANFPKFTQKLRKGFYRVVIGKSVQKGEALDDATILNATLGDQPLHIVPVVKGRSRGGLGKVLAGVLLVGLAMFAGPASVLSKPLLGGALTAGHVAAHIGAGLALTGVASMIAPEATSGDDTKSFTMTGPQVTLREGGIVPIAYGEVITGGTMISGVLKVETNLDP